MMMHVRSSRIYSHMNDIRDHLTQLDIKKVVLPKLAGSSCVQWDSELLHLWGELAASLWSRSWCVHTGVGAESPFCPCRIVCPIRVLDKAYDVPCCFVQRGMLHPLFVLELIPACLLHLGDAWCYWLQNPDGTEKEPQTEEQSKNDPVELRRYASWVLTCCM